MKALILHSDDWEGLYVDGALRTEGHIIFGSYMSVLRAADQYGLTPENTMETWTTEEDDEILYKCGSFPQNQSELKGDYTI